MRKNTFNQGLVNEDKLVDTTDIDFNIASEKNNWNQTKLQISKNIKEIVWKAWIEPLEFLEYKNQILYISASSSLILSRAETQYYDTIFFEASKN